jgi:hypothetical protein
LPPIEQGCEFDSLDSAGNSETEKQPVEMSFDGSARHLELTCDLGIVTALQKQFNNLLFARTEPNGRFRHLLPPHLPSPTAPRRAGLTFPEFIALTMPL